MYNVVFIVCLCYLYLLVCVCSFVCVCSIVDVFVGVFVGLCVAFVPPCFLYSCFDSP